MTQAPAAQATQPTAPRTEYDRSLTAAAVCSNGLVAIWNRDSFPWEHVKMDINSAIFGGGYGLEIATISSGQKLPIAAGQFTKSDGTRLNLDAVACKALNIHADTPHGRLHWNGVF